jgi:hypothetical protein
VREAAADATDHARRPRAFGGGTLLPCKTFGAIRAPIAVRTHDAALRGCSSCHGSFDPHREPCLFAA